MSACLDAALSESISRALGTSVVIAIASRPVPLETLSWGEVSQLSSLATPARRDEWSRGRAALKAVLRALGLAEDTSALAFPHRRYSVTHSGGTAIAVAVVRGELGGVGIDLEMDRAPRLEAARFFLTSDEQAWLRAQPQDARRAHILRLWTIKEAVFKSDPDNASAAFVDYRLDRAEHRSGMALREQSGMSKQFAYVVQRFERARPTALEGGGGTLSVAVHDGVLRVEQGGRRAI